MDLDDIYLDLLSWKIVYYLGRDSVTVILFNFIVSYPKVDLSWEGDLDLSIDAVFYLVSIVVAVGFFVWM